MEVYRYLKFYIFQSKSHKEMGRLDKLLIIVDCGHVRHYDESICIRIRHKEAGGSLLTLSMSIVNHVELLEEVFPKGWPAPFSHFMCYFEICTT